LAKQAKAALHAADPEFAADRMLALANVAPLTSSSWMDTSMGELLSLSAPWASVPEMRTAREQLSFIAAPANRA